MGGISKRVNQTLRLQFIHGARAVIRWCEEKDDALSVWLQNLLKTKPKCKVIVALANKLARIAWAVLSKAENYNVNSLVKIKHYPSFKKLIKKRRSFCPAVVLVMN